LKNTTGSPANNAGFLQRQLIYLGTKATSANRAFSLMIPLRAYFRTPDLLPPNVEIRLQLTRNADSWMTWGDDVATTNCVLQMNSCTVMTKQIKLSEGAAAALSMGLQKTAARLNYSNVRVAATRFAAGTTSIQVYQALPGPRPSRVVVALIPQTALQGGAADNNFATVKVALADVNLQLAGETRQYPVQSMSQATYANGIAATTLTIAEAYEAYAAVARAEPAITSAAFNSYSLMCFDTSRSGDASGRVLDLGEETSINFSARALAAYGEVFSAVVVSWTPGIIEIDGAGVVQIV
jgi:hypothetical protein